MSDKKISFCFKKIFRLSRREGFALPLKQRPLNFGWFAIHSNPNRVGYPRLGIIVSKHLAPHACDRNRIKRLVRESFRQIKTLSLGAGVDTVVRLRQPLLRQEMYVARQELVGALKETMGIK